MMMSASRVRMSPTSEATLDAQAQPGAETPGSCAALTRQRS